jgi:hypothetical protein
MATPGLSPTDWMTFRDEVFPAATRKAEAEIDKPGCRDDETVVLGGEEVPTIVSRFWTERTIAQLAGYVDPREWVRTGWPFWEEMSCIDGPRPTDGGYDGRFREVVLLPTGRITAYLDVTFRQDDSSVYMTYEEAPDEANDDVVIDRGCVFATRQTTDPDDVRAPMVMVFATKSIIFSDPELNGFADLACDNGWVQLMINMATNALQLDQPRRLGVGPRPPRGGQGAPDLVTQWTTEVKRLVDDTATIARRGPRLLSSHRGGRAFLDLVLDAWDQAALATAAGARVWRDGVEQFAKKVEGP